MKENNYLHASTSNKGGLDFFGNIQTLRQYIGMLGDRCYCRCIFYKQKCDSYDGKFTFVCRKTFVIQRKSVFLREILQKI